MSRLIIAERLKDAMGLHAPTVGMMTISSAIDSRMRACTIENDAHYLAHLMSTPNEMKELIEEVLIPETWFFRENQPYEYVLKYFKEAPNKKINILSIPCSTGEEPYSIAMMLMDNHISVDLFNIDAVDIGEKNIAKAKKGQYRKNSFRAEDLSFMDKYFHEENNLFNLAGFVKNKVTFHCNNVLSESFDLGVSHYDIIFCRNLLIYFDTDTQLKMFSTLDRMLKPEGILIIGHAETIQNSNGLFVPAINSKSYVYVKKDNLDKSLPHIQKTRRTMSTNIPNKKSKEQPRAKPFSSSIKNEINPQNKSSNTKRVSNENLDLAFKLADEGKLDDALNICNEFIDSHVESSKAYYLSGVIHDTKGDQDKANRLLHKAIYLDPNNVEALVHLSLLAEQRGEINEANRYKERAQRVQKRQSA